MALLEEAITEEVARLDHASKSYGKVLALQELDLEIHAGEVVALLGPNGAGKTTAVRMLLGLTRPDRGEARLFGGPAWDPRSRYRLGAMLQIARVPDTLRVAEHLELFRSYYPRPKPMPEILVAAGLEGLGHRPFGELSGGQKQRLFFALALAGNPDFLVLDEPTVGLDVEARRRFWETLRSFVEEGGTILLTTHYLEEADALADRVVLLHHGRRIASGSPEEIKDRTAQRRIRCVTRIPIGGLERLDGVRKVRRDGRIVEILCHGAESVVADLLARDPDLKSLEVSSVDLEEAILQLTADAEEELPS